LVAQTQRIFISVYSLVSSTLLRRRPILLYTAPAAAAYSY
jgi:hypothetical protein